MRVLQPDEWNPLAPPIEERLGVHEVGVSEMIGADRRETTALDRFVQKHPNELLVFAKLPDEPSAAPLERHQSTRAEFRPRNGCGRRRASAPRRTDVRPGR